MKKLINNSDLGIPNTTPFNRAIIAAVRSILGINGINELYGRIPDSSGADYARKVLDELGVTVHMEQRQLDYIPRSGPFVVVANHPHGALDGLILIDIIARVRPDVKFLGNFLLTKIEELNEMFLPVDPFDAKNSRNISGVRRAIEHLESGAPLVVFPAGEVSTYQKGFRRMEDKPWSKSMMKFISKADVPIVPIYINGSNSLIFHLVGKIHPVLRTVRLPRELTNKKGRSVSVVIASALTTRRQHEFENLEQLTSFLRANVYVMKSVTSRMGIDKSELSRKPILKFKSVEPKPVDIADPIAPEQIENEINNLPDDALITSVGRMKLYFASAAQIPKTLHEVARLREETFRAVGEGTNMALDTDKYDLSYEHLFVWDSERCAIVGAYRLGFGDRLMREGRGFEGFYTYTLFEFSRGMNQLLSQSIELGRSFISQRYQRQPQGLILLWRGVLAISMKYPQYRYLIGPVSMSGSYSSAAKWLMINYIKDNYWSREMSKSVVAREGLRSLGRPPFAPQLVNGINNEALIEKLMRDIEPNGAGIPVLIRKYFQLSAKVMALNVDPQFCDSLDALILVDLCNFTKANIDLVAREFTGADRETVYQHFRNLGNTNV